MSTACIILSTVNAPYGTGLSAEQLASSLCDIAAAEAALGPVFAFFSEVDPVLQRAFIAEMGLPDHTVRQVAQHIQASCPFPLALAA